MRIAILTGEKEPKYMVMEVSEEDFIAWNEDYADQAYNEYREGVRSAYMQRRRMQNLEEYTENRDRDE